MRVRHRDVIEEQLDDELLLYVPHSRQTYLLNATASAVWRLCNGLHDVDSIVATLACQFVSPQDFLRRDVEDILTLFTAASLMANVG